MHIHGDPVRFFAVFVSSTQAGTIPLTLINPATNLPYPFQVTDYLVIQSYVNASLSAVAGSAGLILNQSTSTSTFTSTNFSGLLGVFGTGNSIGNNWVDTVATEGLSCAQGVIPQVGEFSIGGSTLVTTGGFVLTGTGMVVHAPGVTRPTFLNSQIPTG
jgi:hypothetical protein